VTATLAAIGAEYRHRTVGAIAVVTG